MPSAKRAPSTFGQQPICTSKLKLVHVARRQLGLAEEDYRAMLMLHGGVTSATLLNQQGFTALMDRFKALGFYSTSPRRPLSQRNGMASPGQTALIRHLWAECTAGDGTDSSLGKWLERQFNVSSLHFVSAELAPKVVGGLKGMLRQNAKRAAKAAPQPTIAAAR